MSPIRLDCFLEIQTEKNYQDRKSLSSPKARNTTTITATTATTTTTTTSTTTTTTTTTTWSSRGFQGEVLAKTPGLYQVPELGNWISNFFGFLDRPTDRQTDLYYPLVTDKNRVFSKFHLVGFRKPSFLLIISICT